MNFPVLVTGGAGYIGSHVCKRLKQEGFQPIVYDNLSLGHAWAVKWGPLVEGDLHDLERLKTTCQKHRPMGIIHLAAYSNVRESNIDPIRYYKNNLAGTSCLLYVAKQCEIPYFVFSSTCAIYGHPSHIPIDESHPQLPINPYGQSKKMVETLFHTKHRDDGIHFALLRYFNAAGADPGGEIGEAHDPETHLIPLVMQTLLKQKESFTIFGDDFDTPDGTAIRDYIHVMDLADAHILTLKWLIKHQANLELNLGTGKGYSVKEIIQTIENYTGDKVPIQIGKRFSGDPSILVAANAKAKETLSWSPRYSNLETIIETAWNWHRT